MDGWVRRVVVGAFLFALACGFASSSWACVPEPLVFVRPQASGAAGTQVTIEGVNFGPGESEVRWNGLQGQRLATASGTSFSVPATIPESSPGLYLLTVLTRDDDGAINKTAVVSFQVLSSNPPAPAPTPPEDSANEGRGESSGLGYLALAAGAGLVGGAVSAIMAARIRHDSSPEHRHDGGT